MPVYNFGHYLVPQGTGQAPSPFPAGLRMSGPVIPVQIEIPSALADRLQQSGQAIPAPVSGLALVDTGASVSAVDAGASNSSVCSQLDWSLWGPPAGRKSRCSTRGDSASPGRTSRALTSIRSSAPTWRRKVSLGRGVVRLWRCWAGTCSSISSSSTTVSKDFSRSRIDSHAMGDLAKRHAFAFSETTCVLPIRSLKPRTIASKT